MGGAFVRKYHMLLIGDAAQNVGKSFADAGCHGEDFSTADTYGKRNVGLLFSPYMSDKDQERVIHAVDAFMANSGRM